MGLTRKVCLAGYIFAMLNTTAVSYCKAEVVSFRATGRTTAQLGTNPTSDSSQNASDLVQSFLYDGVGYAYGAVQWEWDGSELSSVSNLQTRQLRDWFFPFLHSASADLSFEFTVSTRTRYDVNGTWGYSGNTPTDTLTVQLNSASGTVYSDSTTSSGGVNSDSFSDSGILDPGTYTFTLGGGLAETYINAGFASGGWNLASFRLTEVSAIPEPSSAGFLYLLIGFLVHDRRRGVNPRALR